MSHTTTTSPKGRAAVQLLKKANDALRQALTNIAYCADCDRLFDVRSGCEADIRADEGERSSSASWKLEDTAPDEEWIVAWVRFEDLAEGWTPAILIDGEWRYTYEVVPKPGIEVLAWRPGPSRPAFLPSEEA